MATWTPQTKHAAVMTSQSKHSATLTAQSKSSGAWTYDQVGITYNQATLSYESQLLWVGQTKN